MNLSLLAHNIYFYFVLTWLLCALFFFDIEKRRFKRHFNGMLFRDIQKTLKMRIIQLTRKQEVINERITNFPFLCHGINFKLYVRLSYSSEKR